LYANWLLCPLMKTNKDRRAKLARMAEWSKLSVGGAAKPKPKMIRVRDLPGVGELELFILGHAPPRGYGIRYFEDQADEVSKKLFGLTRNDTMFRFPDDFESLPEFSEEAIRIWNKYCDFEETSDDERDDLTDDEMVEMLKELGLDFTDERGQPLRCTK